MNSKSISGTIINRYDYRKEEWGYILQDRVHDRIWGVSEDVFCDIAEGNYNEDIPILTAHPYRQKGWFLIGKEPREQFSLSAPVSISWNLTEKCNSQCLFCCNDADSENNYGIATKSIFEILNQLKKWGVLRIILGGGEPLVRKDIKEILLYAHAIGIRPALATNGILLTEELVDIISKVCCTLQISLDAIENDIYSYLRGVDELKNVKKNIIMAVEHRLPVRIVTVITQRNYSQLTGIAQFIKDNGISQWFIFKMLNSGRAIKHKSELGEIDFNLLSNRIYELYDAHPEVDIFTWGNNKIDQIAVYVEANGDICIRNYQKGRLIKLNDIKEGSLYRAWVGFDETIKRNSFLNFVQPNPAIRNNSYEV
jgi:sulfatase maturation enzyme AslB (radical SAM superfamily)